MKRYHQYQMDFEGKWLNISALCMGISLFLSALYYLGLNNMSDISVWERIVCLWLPMILGIGYLVLLRVLKWNAPGVYAIIGAMLCVVLILQSMTVGGAGKIVLSIPIYLLCAVVLLVVMGGFFPAKLPAMLMFGIAIGIRVLFFDLVGLTLAQWVAEGAGLACLASLLFLPMGTKTVNKRKRERT